MSLPTPNDTISERAVLAGLLRHSGEVYADVADLLNEQCFVDEQHKVLYSIFNFILKSNSTTKLDIATTLSTAKELGLYTGYFDNDYKIKYLRSLENLNIQAGNVRPQAQKLRKLLIGRELRNKLRIADKEIENIGGTETFTQIVAKAEQPIHDIINEVTKRESSQIVKLSEVSRDYIKYLEENPDKSLGIPTGFTFYDEKIGGGYRRGKVNVVAARLKVGKAQPLYSTIYTPNGPKLMGDIQIGDSILHPDGNTTKVIAIHPQGKKQIYRIHFKYGEYVDCCEDHLWKVWNRRKKKYEILSLKHIMSHGKGLMEKAGPKWYVPLVNPVSFNEQNLPIDPYVLGTVLGDGNTTKDPTITNIDQDIINKLEANLPKGMKLSQRKNQISYGLINIKKNNKNQIRDYLVSQYLNVTSHHKYIPEIYKYSSKEQRLELIRGLMDTDGGVSINDKGTSNIEYSSTSLRLAKDMQWLIWSIGGLAKIKERYTTYKKGIKFKSYRLSIHIDDPSILFSCERKRNLCKVRSKLSLKRPIIKVEKLESMECQCITVDREDGLYITDNFVVTHNSWFGANVAINVNKQNIPVLILDLELNKEDQLPRILSNIAGITVNNIEKAEFVRDQRVKSRLNAGLSELDRYELYHVEVGGMSFEEILAVCRRWITRYVGFDKNGKTNPALIVYDYIDIHDAGELGNLQETQLLGLYMMGLENFASHYEIPFMVLAQTNRDGISQETTNVVAGSDRIGRKCANLSILKFKSEEEIKKDGPDLGNRKLVIAATRFGEGHAYGEYVHIGSNLRFGKFVELGEKWFNGTDLVNRIKQKPEFEVDSEAIDF